MNTTFRQEMLCIELRKVYLVTVHYLGGIAAGGFFFLVEKGPAAEATDALRFIVQPYDEEDCFIFPCNGAPVE
jgi:hypothetical protein